MERQFARDLPKSRRRNTRYQASLVVTNTFRPIVDRYLHLFGGSVQVRRKAQEHHRTGWNWKVGDLKAVAVLEQVRPYLFVKAKQADLVLEFILDRPPKPIRWEGLAPEELTRRERIYRELCLLNSRSVAPAETKREGTFSSNVVR